MDEKAMQAVFLHEKINAVLKKAKSDNKRTIAFWSTSPRFSPWEWIVPFVRSLGGDTHFPIFLSTYPADEYCKLDIPHFVIAADQLAQLDFLDCLVAATDDDEGDFPQNCRVLAVAHASMYNASSAFLHAVYHQTKFDGYLVNCHLANSAHQIKELWTGLLPRRMFRRKSARFDVLACGYLRSAALQEELRRSSVPRDAICYAPMARDLAREHGGDRIALYAKKILRTLLTNFRTIGSSFVRLLMRKSMRIYGNSPVRSPPFPSFMSIRRLRGWIRLREAPYWSPTSAMSFFPSLSRPSDRPSPFVPGYGKNPSLRLRMGPS